MGQLETWDAQKQDRLRQNAECMQLAVMVLDSPAGRFADRKTLAARILRRGLEPREQGEVWL